MNESTLVRHERNDEITNYVEYRKAKEISDTTIRNEMVTINNFIKYCFADVKVTHISAFKYTAMPKKALILMPNWLEDKHFQVMNTTHLQTH